VSVLKFYTRYTVFRQETPTHVFFFISFENVQIFAKFSENV